MNLVCVLRGHRLQGQTSLYSRFVVCQRCNEHWDANGLHLRPAFDRAELKRNIRRGVPMSSASYHQDNGRRLPSKTVATAWVEYLIETNKLLGKDLTTEQVQELRKMADNKPGELVRTILGG